jgi:short-subunit dehydrogenase
VEAVLPQMRQRRTGRIVNISPIGGKVSVPHLLPYVVSKFALSGFSEGLHAELAKDGIVVTTVIPGLMRTGSPPHAFFKGKNQAEYAWFSIGDSLPFITISAERAAEQILEACQRGDPEVTLTWPAQLAVLLEGLFPDLVAGLLAFTNRLLPGPGGIGTERREGRDSQSAVSPSVLTTLGDRASLQNNEVTAVGR